MLGIVTTARQLVGISWWVIIHGSRSCSAWCGYGTDRFHASHEQLHPRVLLNDAVHAERAGFDAVMSSDHLAPWTQAQGHSGFTWTWLGAALQATDRIPMGAFHAPGQRYHPVISAHAMATVAAMFPGRLPWVALGSGEALNEHVTGDPWPTKPERMERLRECVDVMRALWRGEEVSHRGHVVVDRARLWSLPDKPPRLVAGAMSVETAAWAAQWADGLITTINPVCVFGPTRCPRSPRGRPI